MVLTPGVLKLAIVSVSCLQMSLRVLLLEARCEIWKLVVGK